MTKKIVSIVLGLSWLGGIIGSAQGMDVPIAHHGGAEGDIRVPIRVPKCRDDRCRGDGECQDLAPINYNALETCVYYCRSENWPAAGCSLRHPAPACQGYKGASILVVTRDRYTKRPAFFSYFCFKPRHDQANEFAVLGQEAMIRGWYSLDNTYCDATRDSGMSEGLPDSPTNSRDFLFADLETDNIKFTWTQRFGNASGTESTSGQDFYHVFLKGAVCEFSLPQHVTLQDIKTTFTDILNEGNIYYISGRSYQGTMRNCASFACLFLERFNIPVRLHCPLVGEFMQEYENGSAKDLAKKGAGFFAVGIFSVLGGVAVGVLGAVGIFTALGINEFITAVKPSTIAYQLYRAREQLRGRVVRIQTEQFGGAPGFTNRVLLSDEVTRLNGDIRINLSDPASQYADYILVH